jgi:hypothetical protein
MMPAGRLVAAGRGSADNVAPPASKARIGVKDIDLQTAVVRSDKLLFSQIDSDVTMMSIDTGRYYSLGSVGARVWALLEQPASASDICQRLQAEYRVDASQCEAEVLALLRQMAGEGVVEVVAPDSGQQDQL